MTDWQIKFATNYWTDKLRLNPKITIAQANSFAIELTRIIKKQEPSAICIVMQPQLTLELALRTADLPADALPETEIDMIFLSDGSIRLREDGEWTTKEE